MILGVALILSLLVPCIFFFFFFFGALGRLFQDCSVSWVSSLEFLIIFCWMDKLGKSLEYCITYHIQVSLKIWELKQELCRNCPVWEFVEDKKILMEN